MTGRDVRVCLAGHREMLQSMGVKSLALFGSVVRDEATEASDVDLLVEFDQPVGLFEYARLQRKLEEILGAVKVDLVMRRAVFDELKEDIYAEAVDAF